MGGTDIVTAEDSWDEIRERWEWSTDSYRSLAAEFGVSRSAIHRRAAAEGWERQTPEGQEAEGRRRAQTAKATQAYVSTWQAKRGQVADRAGEAGVKLLERLVEAIDGDPASGAPPMVLGTKAAQTVENLARGADRMIRLADDLSRGSERVSAALDLFLEYQVPGLGDARAAIEEGDGG